MQDWLTRLSEYFSTDQGRALLLYGIGGLIVFLALVFFLRRWRGQPQAVPGADLEEDLGTYPAPAVLPASSPLLSLYGLPVRLRLVVIGPLGLDAGSVQQEEVGELLDLAVPGLADRLRLDQPRVRLWPTQLSQQGFVAAFRRNTMTPDAAEKTHRWVLVMGKVLRDGSPVAVGLVLHAKEPNTLGPVILNYPHQWMEVLRLQRLSSV